MNTYAIDCFSKSPTMRRSGGPTVTAIATATAPVIAPRAPRANVHAATNTATATNGSAAASTTRVAQTVAVSMSQPHTSIAAFASAASRRKVSGTSAQRSLPSSSSSRACTA